MEDEELLQQVRDELSRDCLHMTKEVSYLLFDNIDSFVALSRENTSVIDVVLYPFVSLAGNYEFWDKVGRMIGNLRVLRAINISFLPDDEDDGNEARMPDWEIVTRSLRRLRHKISLRSYTDDHDAEVDDIRGFARAIHGHPMISEFSSSTGFTFGTIGSWCSALTTLPSLERFIFGLQEPETEDQRGLLNLEPFKELLRTPALRVVKFYDFYFTNELCHATGDALEDGSSIIDITFDNLCTFPAGGRAIISDALKTNALVTDVEFIGGCDELFFCNTLATVLLCNSTLQNLAFRLPEQGAGGRWRPEGASGRSLSSIFLSLGMNTTLKRLYVGIFDEFGDKLCAAIRNGLAKNSTLEELILDKVIPSDDDGAFSARNALSFLRTNSTLKSLTVSFAPAQKESFVSAFRFEAVKMLENPILESLTIIDQSGRGIKVKELLALLSALQLNTTLKTLGFQSDYYKNVCFTIDEASKLVSILMKNYGLERLVLNFPCADDRTVKAILRLNAAGRRYLIKDGSSISKGVDVLSAVSDEIDCVFLHLLENPNLCDRRAAETSTTGSRRPDSNLDESSSTGKRERALSLSGTEPRRRLA
jgi:hypothetical protein